MTARRSFGMFALLAMVHFIIVGTAAACATRQGDSHSVAGHANCTSSTSHSKQGSTDRPAEPPCCEALASCATTALAARIVPAFSVAPTVSLVIASFERAPGADAPAPELPPPKA